MPDFHPVNELLLGPSVPASGSSGQRYTETWLLRAGTPDAATVCFASVAATHERDVPGWSMKSSRTSYR